MFVFIENHMMWTTIMILVVCVAYIEAHNKK